MDRNTRERALPAHDSRFARSGSSELVSISLLPSETIVLYVNGIEVCEHVGRDGVRLMSHSSTCWLLSHSGRCSIGALRQQELSSMSFRANSRIKTAQGQVT